MKADSRYHRWLQLAALTAALAAVVLLASGISFWHTDAPGSDATCPICHVAHVSATAPGVGQAFRQR